jgi:hypothetical protein
VIAEALDLDGTRTTRGAAAAVQPFSGSAGSWERTSTDFSWIANAHATPTTLVVRSTSPVPRSVTAIAAGPQ